MAGQTFRNCKRGRSNFLYRTSRGSNSHAAGCRMPCTTSLIVMAVLLQVTATSAVCVSDLAALHGLWTSNNLCITALTVK